MRAAIQELAKAAQAERVATGLGAQGQEVWDALCDEAAQVVLALFVRGNDSRLDWGLRGLGARVTDATLLTVYWWMLLYQFVMLRNRGIQEFAVDKAFSEFRHAAERFATRRAPAHGLAAGEPQAWEEHWDSQVALEASLGIYDSTLEQLGMSIDATERIDRVSLFTTATEKAYDSRIRNRLGRGGEGEQHRR